MTNMKGFVFTVDAIFCLIVASAAISILLYIYYLPPLPYEAPIAEAYSILQSMAQTSMQQAAIGNLWAMVAVDGYESRQYTWPQYGYNGTLSSSTPGYAPWVPDILFRFRAPCSIFPVTAAADGLVFLTTGPASSCSSPQLYELNATNGNVVRSTSIGAPYVSGPMVYDHIIYVANSVNLYAISETGNLLWYTPTYYQPPTDNAIVTLEDGYVNYGDALYYPFNGLFLGIMANAIPGPVAYGHGEFVGMNSLYGTGYSLNGNTFTTLWVKKIIDPTLTMPTTPAIGYNYTVLNFGDNVVVTSLSGNNTQASWLCTLQYFCPGGAEWSNSIGAQIQGGPALIGHSIFLETTSQVIGYSSYTEILDSQIGTNYVMLPDVLMDWPTITNKANVTPSVAQNLVLFQPGGDTLLSAFTAGGFLNWNLTLPSPGPLVSYYGDIPLAYGNAYVVDGSVLYGFGDCKANPTSSVLAAVATMYLDGQGACANMILNGSNLSSTNYGIFINSQYGPSINTAKFNGKNSYVEVNDTANMRITRPITINAWVFPENYQSQIQVVYKENTYDLEILPGGTVRFGDAVGGNPPSASITSTTSVPLGRWTDITATMNDVSSSAVSSSTARIYMNASLQPASYSGGWASTGGAGYDTFIGAAASSGTMYDFNGLIADVVIYNASLNANQVALLYDTGPGGVPPLYTSNVTSWWPLEGDTNDYGPYYNIGYPSNVIYTPGGYVPAGVSRSYLVSRAAVPLYLTAANYTSGLYNVSVVSWK